MDCNVIGVCLGCTRISATIEKLGLVDKNRGKIMILGLI